MIKQEELESRLRTALRQRAAATVIDEPSPYPSTRTVRSRRWPLTAAVALSAAALLVAGLLVVRDDDGVRTEAPAAPPEDRSGRLPSYELELPGVTTQTNDDSQGAPGGPSQSAAMEIYVQSFRSPTATFDGPMVWIKDVRWAGAPDPNSGFGFGEASPVAREVPVRGYTGYVSTYEGTVTVGVPIPAPHANEGLYVFGRGITEDDLIGFVEGLVARPDGVRGYDVTVPIAGLERAFEGPDTWIGARNVTTGFTDGEGVEYELVIGEGDQSTFEALISDRAHSAGSVWSSSVGDSPAALVRYSGANDDHTLMWQPTPATVAELRAAVSTERMREVAAALRPVAPDTWVHQPSPPVRDDPAPLTTSTSVP